MEGEICISKEYYLKDNTTPIVFDSGCTVAVTPHITDFIQPPTKVSKTMNGLPSVLLWKQMVW